MQAPKHSSVSIAAKPPEPVSPQTHHRCPTIYQNQTETTVYFQKCNTFRSLPHICQVCCSPPSPRQELPENFTMLTIKRSHYRHPLQCSKTIATPFHNTNNYCKIPSQCNGTMGLPPHIYMYKSNWYSISANSIARPCRNACKTETKTKL